MDAEIPPNVPRKYPTVIWNPWKMNVWLITKKIQYDDLNSSSDYLSYTWFASFQCKEFKWPDVSVKCQDFLPKDQIWTFIFESRGSKMYIILGWWVQESVGYKSPWNTVVQWNECSSIPYSTLEPYHTPLSTVMLSPTSIHCRQGQFWTCLYM